MIKSLISSLLIPTMLSANASTALSVLPKLSLTPNSDSEVVQEVGAPDTGIVDYNLPENQNLSQEDLNLMHEDNWVNRYVSSKTGVGVPNLTLSNFLSIKELYTSYETFITEPSDMPKSVKFLSNITWIGVTRSQLRSVCDEVNMLPNCREINVSGCMVTSIPDKFTSPKLKCLNFNDNVELSKVPISDNLSSLHLERTSVVESDIRSHYNVDSYDRYHYSYSKATPFELSIGNTIDNLKEAKKNTKFNQYVASKLNKTVDQLTVWNYRELGEFVFSYAQDFGCTPDDVFKSTMFKFMTGLVKLDLVSEYVIDPNYMDIPDCIYNFRNLRELSLPSKGIVLNGISNLTELKRLEIGNNRLPDNVDALIKLKTLIVHNSDNTVLDNCKDSLMRLPSLVSLGFSPAAYPRWVAELPTVTDLIHYASSSPSFPIELLKYDRLKTVSGSSYNANNQYPYDPWICLLSKYNRGIYSTTTINNLKYIASVYIKSLSTLNEEDKGVLIDFVSKKIQPFLSSLTYSDYSSLSYEDLGNVITMLRDCGEDSSEGSILWTLDRLYNIETHPENYGVSKYLTKIVGTTVSLPDYASNETLGYIAALYDTELLTKSVLLKTVNQTIPNDLYNRLKNSITLDSSGIYYFPSSIPNNTFSSNNAYNKSFTNLNSSKLNGLQFLIMESLTCRAEESLNQNLKTKALKILGQYNSVGSSNIKSYANNCITRLNNLQCTSFDMTTTNNTINQVNINLSSAITKEQLKSLLMQLDSVKAQYDYMTEEQLTSTKAQVDSLEASINQKIKALEDSLKVNIEKKIGDIESNGLKNESQIKEVEDLIAQLEDSDDKTSFQNRLNKIKDDFNNYVKAANDAVAKAQSDLTKSNLDEALAKVLALPTGDTKTDLRSTLIALQLSFVSSSSASSSDKKDLVTNVITNNYNNNSNQYNTMSRDELLNLIKNLPKEDRKEAVNELVKDTQDLEGTFIEGGNKLTVLATNTNVKVGEQIDLAAITQTIYDGVKLSDDQIGSLTIVPSEGYEDYFNGNYAIKSGTAKFRVYLGSIKKNSLETTPNEESVSESGHSIFGLVPVTENKVSLASAPNLDPSKLSEEVTANITASSGSSGSGSESGSGSGSGSGSSGSGSESGSGSNPSGENQNIDVSFKNTNTISLTVSSNSVTFGQVSGLVEVDATTPEDVTATVKSSLGYSLTLKATDNFVDKSDSSLVVPAEKLGISIDGGAFKNLTGVSQKMTLVSSAPKTSGLVNDRQEYKIKFRLSEIVGLAEGEYHIPLNLMAEQE